jgi:hypothetical protein
MKLGIKRKQTDSGREFYVIYDWYWYNCGLYNTLEQAEKVVVSILEEEKERRQKKPSSTEVYYELCDNEIVRIQNGGN